MTPQPRLVPRPLALGRYLLASSSDPDLTLRLTIRYAAAKDTVVLRMLATLPPSSVQPEPSTLRSPRELPGSVAMAWESLELVAVPTSRERLRCKRC